MKPNWLISSNCFNDGNPEKMRIAVEDQGCKVNWFKYVPFESDQNQKLRFQKDDCVIVYGSIELTKLVQRSRAWIPGAWVNWEDFRCVNYLSYWGKYSVHHDYAFMPLAEIIRFRKEIYSRFSNQGKVFFRPDSNAKGYAGTGFNAEVVHEDHWDKFVKEGLNYPVTTNLNTLTMFSRPSKILKEWRFIIADKKVITGSQYREMINGQSSVEIREGYPQEAANFAEMVVGYEWEPAPIFSMDIGFVEGVGMRMIEIGGFNCAGLYACHIGKIVEAANKIAEREYQILSS